MPNKKKREKTRVTNLRNEGNYLYRSYKHQKDTENVLAKTLCQ